MGRNAKHFANLFMRTVFQNRKTENHAVTLRQTVNNTAQFIPRKWLFLISDSLVSTTAGSSEIGTKIFSR